jgi:YHS domain-containing protein
MKNFIFMGVLLALSACHSGNETVLSVAAPPVVTPVADSIKTFNPSVLDNKKDPVCGMPAAAGMEDTVHLHGKVIGFCSKECKSLFLKSPKKYPIAYK